MSDDVEPWTVERHLAAASAPSAALYERLDAVLRSFGPVRVSVSKTAVTFKGTRRGFAGARPKGDGLVGYLDLMRRLPEDPRIRSAVPYQRNLVVHQFRLLEDADLDDQFVAWLREGYDVGCGAHLQA
ncbi:hypothetical protein Bcav_3453 [Beutenbergia cavernae DSM 12333]|uniref:DUF5655 domain-containing protein n=1 Tax=Beutenbergia cavernae (strain ATCC BAA-8 / DSM 12333 / CCUG 43141 / JCM 11478 / NBRC 16432 / NCIMB 13614 / HKI 0122) TaxID=471853 RepID=C5C270_BEUC1|nr:DUF5655 domain-containing protein [Beutenbergia cavernae]ACQ81695.1 hypothetical protein Bcav_3453 [Beutenbergia cavernae DSM 12333]